MEVSRSRWVAIFVIAVSVLITALLSIMIPIINYGSNSNLEAVWEDSQWSTPTLTPTQDPNLLLMLETDTGSIPVEPNATPNPNCTHSALYWVYNLEAWPDQFVQGSLFYTRSQAQSLIQSPNVDASSVLLIQYLAVYLNFNRGADLSDVVDVMTEASDWLSGHPQGSTLSAADAQEAFQMAERLEDFNIGVIGPGRCPDDLVALAGQIAKIPVPVLSVTPELILSTIAFTPTPVSPTPSRTPVVTVVRATYVPPTATDEPSQKPKPKPTNPPPPPPPPPPPTDPPPRPTEPPDPTDEPPPPPP